MAEIEIVKIKIMLLNLVQQLMKVLIAEDGYNIAMLYRVTSQNKNHEVLLTYDGEAYLKSYHEAFEKFVFRE
jgi:hypothetical protein